MSFRCVLVWSLYELQNAKQRTNVWCETVTYVGLNSGVRDDGGMLDDKEVTKEDD